MIYIERNQKNKSGKVFKPNAAWFQRSADATETALEEQDRHEANGAIYKHTEVRKALERLFHDKCAYCESKVTATDDWNVEHFRPSGRVAEREDHHGYYWLAYAWENLYLSCTHCNQARKDQPRWEDTRQLPTRGKADQFPLLDEDTRAMGPSDDIYSEHTLLIDPCFDDPAEYLGYDPTGQIFSLGDLDNNPYGGKTIEVLHLYRRRLRDRRREMIKTVLKVIRLIERAASKNESNSGLAKELEVHLNCMQASDCEFAGVARYVTKHRTEFGL